jgi:hypothetical protein
MAWNCQKVMLNNLGSQHELAQAVRALGIDTRPLRYKDYWWKGKARADPDTDTGTDTDTDADAQGV